ncbi:maleylpyruvate isomerase family mycothiol-dependent enzyme [Lentzea sp.]|uniref:maleylpyruvate isomerase family mycothiol-dependent enzyme n=1 Tax=Lentzea sp. TaxID=56099 RepID=UPI002ED25E36
MTVTADDLDAVVSCLADTLGQATGRDWTAPPGTGEWNCRDTAEHVGDCLLSYAAQLVARPDGRYVRFLAVADKEASPAELLEFAVAGGRILASVVRTTPPTVRAYHPTGTADPAHFAGMGCVEVLVHGEDIARGLGLALDPPRDVCARVLARMFRHDDLGVDPWTGLLWATDRVALPGREQQTGWRWQGPPD